MADLLSWDYEADLSRDRLHRHCAPRRRDGRALRPRAAAAATPAQARVLGPRRAPAAGQLRAGAADAAAAFDEHSGAPNRARNRGPGHTHSGGGRGDGTVPPASGRRPFPPLRRGGRRNLGAARHQPRRGRGRVRRRPGPVGLREEHAAQHRGRPCHADHGQRRGLRGAAVSGAARPVWPAARLRVPGSQPPAVAQRPAQRHPASRASGPGQGGAGGSGARVPRDRWPLGLRQASAAPTVRRHAAAGLDRPGARLRTRDRPHGRAVRGAGRHDPATR